MPELAIYVFLGPSLDPATADSLLKATYLPPVVQGDILRLLPRNPDVILIIDGGFELTPSVWHKEILLALENGVHVFGASSMGALRAAELAPFGMIGIGRIYQMFLSSELEDDDEVAVIHGPADAGHIAFSTAMVDVRDVVAAAVAAGVLTSTSGMTLIRAAKALHYPDRRFERIVELAIAQGTSRSEVEAFEVFRREYGPGLKSRDAIAALGHVAAFAAGGFGLLETPWKVERTVFLEEARREAELAVGVEWSESTTPLPDASPGPVPDQTALNQALLGELAGRELERRGIEVTDEEVQATADAFRLARNLVTRSETVAWLRAVGVTEDGFGAAMIAQAKIARLERLWAGALAPAAQVLQRLATGSTTPPPLPLDSP